MEELKAILTAHTERYPLMQPQDAVKLIYQNEFGGGHMIRDEQACRDYLRREYAAASKDKTMPLYEEIGNGIVRVNLSAMKADEVEKLGDAFICSAAIHKGSLHSFLQKLTVLQKLTAAGAFMFDAHALAAYLADYEKAGYPAVSHSGVYRDAYNPAYRVVRKEYVTW